MVELMRLVKFELSQTDSACHFRPWKLFEKSRSGAAEIEAKRVASCAS